MQLTVPRVACSAAGNCGRPGEREVDLQHRALHRHGLDARPEVGGRGAVEQAEDAPRVGVADHGAGGDRGAVLELDALAGMDRGDRRAGRDHRAGLARRVGERERHPAHPAAHVGPGAGDAGQPPARVMPGDVGGAGIARGGERPDHALARQRVDHAVGEEALEHRRVAVLEHRRDRDLVAAQPRLDLLARRRLRQPQVVGTVGPQRVADAADQRGVLLVAAAVADAELLDGAVLVDPLGERGAVLARDGDVGVLGLERDQLVAVAVQRELVDHQRVQEPGEVGAGRDRVAGPRLLERARAADLLAALEHEYAAAGAGEVGGRGQPVVAGADDDGVPGPICHLVHAADPKWRVISARPRSPIAYTS